MNTSDQTNNQKENPHDDVFAEPIAKIHQGVRDGGRDTDLQADAQELFAGLKGKPEKFNTVVQQLAPIVTESNFAGAAFVAVLAGALIEEGANPDLIAQQLLTGYCHALETARKFLAMCLDCPPLEEDIAAATDEDGELDAEELAERLIDRYGAQISEKHPELGNAWESMTYFGQASNAVLSRSAYARTLAGNNEDLVSHLQALESLAPNAIYSSKLAQVLDAEEIVVLHRESGQGFRIEISGIEDNFQLHTLLGNAINGENGLPFQKPTATEVEIALRHKDLPDDFSFTGLFNMVNWTQYAPAQKPDEDTDSENSPLMELAEHWIWNEGEPADIVPFNGVRIIAIEDAPYNRTWQIGAMFPNMTPELKILERLTKQQVNEWFEKFENTTY